MTEVADIKQAAGMLSRVISKKCHSWEKYETHPGNVIEAAEDIATLLFDIARGDAQSLRSWAEGLEGDQQ